MKNTKRTEYYVSLSNNSFGKNYDQYIVQSRRISDPPALEEVEAWVLKHVLKGAEERIEVGEKGKGQFNASYYQMR